MKILFDILHPAHVHFFRQSISELRDRGHPTIVVARDKDLTLQLLDLYDIPYSVISREAPAKTGMAIELLRRNWKLGQIMIKERPSTMASIGGISTAQVGFLTRTRNLIFYDTENATLSNWLSYPFATQVVTPECYRGWVPKRKHIPYAGYHELAYLHRNRFTPDPKVLRDAGVDPEQSFSVVRFVSWKAMHDVKAKGFSPEDKLRLARTLEEFGEVYITSEKLLPEEFEKYHLPLPPHQVHHLLGFARLFIGESATMASESAVLGTPFVYLDIVGRGYTNEQEERYGLGFNYRPWEVDESIAKAREILSGNFKDTDRFKEGHARMLAEKIDVTEFIIEKLLDAGTR